jgi:hypothetical protein
MISETIKDHRFAHLLMRRIQFSWGALGDSNSQRSVRMEEWNELAIQTGNCSKTIAERDREFRVFLKGRQVRKHLSNASFSKVPYPAVIMMRGMVNRSEDVLSDFKLWSEMVPNGRLDDVNFSTTTKIGFRGADWSKGNSWNLLLRGGGQLLGAEYQTPSYVAITAPTDAPDTVLHTIQQIGFDNQLEEELRRLNGNAFNYRSKDHPENALSRCDQEGPVTQVIQLVEEHLRQKHRARLFVGAMLNLPGRFLVAGRDTQKNQAIEDFLKERANYLSQSLLSSSLDTDWEVQISGASEVAAYGAGWDRRGSVLENVDTKLVVSALKAEGLKHNLVLHYHSGEYRVEIEGLSADSVSGGIISDWGVSFK